MPLATFRMEEAYNAIDSSLILDLDAANYSRTGTTWNDATRNGNNGTLVNGVGYSTANNGAIISVGAIPTSLRAGNANLMIGARPNNTTFPLTGK